MDKTNAFNVLEAAQYLRLSKNYLYRLCYLGLVKCYKPSHGKLYFLKKDLDAYITSNVRAVRKRKK